MKGMAKSNVPLPMIHLFPPTGKCQRNQVKPRKPRLSHAARAYPGFRSMKRLGVFLLPLDGMQVHRRSLFRNLLGFPNNTPIPIYTPGWREALWEWSVQSSNPDRSFRERTHWPLGHCASHAKEINYCTISGIYCTPNIKHVGESHEKMASFPQQSPQQLKTSFIEILTDEQMEVELATIKRAII